MFEIWFIRTFIRVLEVFVSFYKFLLRFVVNNALNSLFDSIRSVSKLERDDQLEPLFLTDIDGENAKYTFFFSRDLVKTLVSMLTVE